MISLIPLFLALTSSIHAVQVANLNVTESIAAQFGCGPTCYNNLQKGLAADVSVYGAIYDSEFYDTAHNFSIAKPGDALKLKPINGTLLNNIPDGTTAYRFQYVSEDLYGKKVPATGFIAFPYASQTNDHRYRTVAYAHGTSGVFRGCAPSATPSLFEYGSWRFLIERGYAVIAADYAGLGNNYTAHQYEASPAQANDLYYSIAAAQTLFGHALTTDWMSVGHSQGGAAVWALAESSLVQNNPLHLGRYLGTVAQAPAVRLKDTALIKGPSLDESSSPSARLGLGGFGWLVLGLRSILPGDPQSWLRPAYRERLELATLVQTCNTSMQSLAADLDANDMFDFTDPSFGHALDTLQNLTARGEGKNEQPILIVQGLADDLVPPEVVMASQNVSCQSGNEVHLQLYPKINHMPVIPASAPSFLRWMDDRFDSINTTGQCSTEVIQPFDTAYVYTRIGTG